MRYSKVKKVEFDTEVFARKDTQFALRVHAEYVEKMSGRPTPKFFEVDRTNEKIDHLWHVPLTTRTQFMREILMPSVITFEKNRYEWKQYGTHPQRRTMFWLARNHLINADYYPQRGDIISYDCYRYIITHTDFPPEVYWGQTNVWLGMVCQTQIAIDGDAKPIAEKGNIAREEFNAEVRPEPLVEPPLFPSQNNAVQSDNVNFRGDGENQPNTFKNFPGDL